MVVVVVVGGAGWWWAHTAAAHSHCRRRGGRGGGGAWAWASAWPRALWGVTALGVLMVVGLVVALLVLRRAQQQQQQRQESDAPGTTIGCVPNRRIDGVGVRFSVRIHSPPLFFQYTISWGLL